MQTENRRESKLQSGTLVRIATDIRLMLLYCPPQVITFSYQPVRRDFGRSPAHTIEGLKESYSVSWVISLSQYLNPTD